MSFFGGQKVVERILPYPYSELKEILPFHMHGWLHTQKALGRALTEAQPKTIIEIGSWLGESTSFFARWLPVDGRVFAVDTWEGSDEHRAKPEWAALLPTLYEQFLSNIVSQQLERKIFPLRGTSREVWRAHPDLRSEFIFIDGSHKEDDVLADCARWVQRLLPGGALCGDDWAWPSVQRAVKTFALCQDCRIITDGDLWVVKKRA